MIKVGMIYVSHQKDSYGDIAMNISQELADDGKTKSMGWYRDLNSNLSAKESNFKSLEPMCFI